VNPRRLVVVVLWIVVVLFMVAGWTMLILTGDAFANAGNGQADFITMVGLAAPALSLAMLRRHPDEWSGPLVGVSVVAAMLATARGGNQLGWFAALAGLIAFSTALVPAVVALHYPALGVAPRLRRWVARCWWLTVAFGLSVGVTGMLGGSVPAYWWTTDDPGAAGAGPTVLLPVYALVVLIGLTLTVVAATARYRSMPGGGRSVLRPVVVPLIGWAVATALEIGWLVVGTVTGPEVDVRQQGSTSYFTILPTLLVVVLAAGIGWVDITVRRPSGGDEQDSWPGGGRETHVERYLSRALADPSIRVLYPVPSTEGPDFVDLQGRPAVIDDAAPDRSVTAIRRGSTLIGLIEQDAAATARPDAVELVATGAGLIMETEGLTAAARQDLDRSRRLAARLLSAGDRPRAELRQTLLDGPLAELTRVADEVEQGLPLGAAAGRLTAVAAQVRTLSHGVFPPALIDDGLPAALPEATVPDRRYPAVVEMTAYLAAHADPGATVVEVDQTGGRALRIRTARPPAEAVRDRIVALGGRLDEVETGWQLTVPVG
jgi:hypothetical protein